MSLVYITHHDENILECEQDFVRSSGPKAAFYVFRHRKLRFYPHISLSVKDNKFY